MEMAHTCSETKCSRERSRKVSARVGGGVGRVACTDQHIGILREVAFRVCLDNLLDGCARVELGWCHCDLVGAFKLNARVWVGWGSLS